MECFIFHGNDKRKISFNLLLLGFLGVADVVNFFLDDDCIGHERPNEK